MIPSCSAGLQLCFLESPTCCVNKNSLVFTGLWETEGEKAVEVWRRGVGLHRIIEGDLEALRLLVALAFLELFFEERSALVIARVTVRATGLLFFANVVCTRIRVVIDEAEGFRNNKVPVENKVGNKQTMRNKSHRETKLSQ